MKRDPIASIWLAGLALALLLYFVGTDRFWFHLLDTVHVVGWWVSETIDDLSGLTVELVRALALGLFATFVALCWLAARRGAAVRGTALLVARLFLLLAGGSDDAGNLRWTAALGVAGIGALAMTRRLQLAGALATVGRPGR